MPFIPRSLDLTNALVLSKSEVDQIPYYSKLRNNDFPITNGVKLQPRESREQEIHLISAERLLGYLYSLLEGGPSAY
jgi:hypothetical protein